MGDSAAVWALVVQEGIYFFYLLALSHIVTVYIALNVCHLILYKL